MTDRLAYPISEACEQLSISRSSMYALEREGRIAFTKIGRRTVIKADELRRFLDATPAR